MTKLRAFLIGIIVGQALMLPHIIRWMKYPVIAAFPVSQEIYSSLPTYEEHIADVITKEIPEPRPMHIYLMNVELVRAKFKEIYGYEEPNLLGFYLFDTKTQQHTVYCVRSPEVVAHEIRHAFEGSYHRNE